MLGGQWTGPPDLSGVWPTMHTNTSGITTAFSDLEPENDLVYPSGRDILDYLYRYAETFGLMSRIRFGTRVELLSAETTTDGSSATPARPSVSSAWWWRPAGSNPPRSQPFPGWTGSPVRLA